MKQAIILALFTVTLFSCKKKDILGPGGSGDYEVNVIFPLHEGDIWRCDIITYNQDSSKNYEVFYDTIDAPAVRDDGKEYYSFFWEYYTLLDDNTVQTSFHNRDWWGDRYPGEYIWFADVKKVDTISTIKFYSDVSPFNAMTVAYPEQATINGYRCKRTEIIYFDDYGGYRYEGKKVLYFSKGNGPVYDALYWVRPEGNNYANPNAKSIEFKVMERHFKRIYSKKG